jgi:hypothetical protein
MYETVEPNWIYTIAGAAWAGEADVDRVAVSTDGGRTWSEAQWLDPARRYAWRRWTLDWLTPSTPGRHVLLARATDADGHVQPDTHDPSCGGYAITHVLPIDVFVGDRATDSP